VHEAPPRQVLLGALMSDDAKLGLILLFMVFALMVIGPALAG
jgi:hypothetical protein